MQAADFGLGKPLGEGAGISQTREAGGLRCNTRELRRQVTWVSAAGSERAPVKSGGPCYTMQEPRTYLCLGGQVLIKHLCQCVYCV